MLIQNIKPSTLFEPFPRKTNWYINYLYKREYAYSTIISFIILLTVIILMNNNVYECINIESIVN